MAESTLTYDPDDTIAMLFRKGIPQVVVIDGQDATAFDDRYVGPQSTYGPIARAATIARLRALADELEKEPTDG